MANIPGPGEPKSLARIKLIKRSHQLAAAHIDYNSTIITTAPISLKEMTEFFIGKDPVAPNFNTNAPFRIGEFSGMRKFEQVLVSGEGGPK